MEDLRMGKMADGHYLVYHDGVPIGTVRKTIVMGQTAGSTREEWLIERNGKVYHGCDTRTLAVRCLYRRAVEGVA